ncbi:DDE-type integrase/transposase/recombinase [Streptomyces sp. NPDC002172]
MGTGLDRPAPNARRCGDVLARLAHDVDADHRFAVRGGERAQGADQDGAVFDGAGMVADGHERGAREVGGGDPHRYAAVAAAVVDGDVAGHAGILAHLGIAKVYSFHMTLSYSRDPFCCFTTSQDLQTFFDCHRRAFAHYGGVPMSIVYDRTKTVVRRHVALRFVP